MDSESAVKILEAAVCDEALISITLSDPWPDQNVSWKKVNIRPVQLRGKLLRQWEYHERGKVLHQNRDCAASAAEMREIFGSSFRQAQIYAADRDTQVLIDAKRRARVLTKPPSKTPRPPEHNQAKKHIIPEDLRSDFLIRLGVMSADGKVIAAKYDKFRQINRFLEMVRDIVDELPADRTINVVDFGCGKSYLTFALYHYLHELLGRAVNIVGLDLKTDVVAFCNRVAGDLGYAGLTFGRGDIRNYDPATDIIDLTVSLHACDTATDHALAQAVRWRSKVILAVPCCQHELYDQIKNPAMNPLLKHGILRERLASLVTDAARGGWLELQGYSVQMLEFISPEHTPKNIMIRAVKRHAAARSGGTLDEYRQFLAFWNVNPTIDGL